MQPVANRPGRRFAWYASSTFAKMGEALPPVVKMQRDICDAIVEDAAGEITAEFVDYPETDKAELERLIGEARDAESRRFDTVIVYVPSNLDLGVDSAREREEEITATGVDVIFVGRNMFGPHSQASP